MTGLADEPTQVQPVAPSASELGPRGNGTRPQRPGGVNPLLVVAVAFAAGVLLAKVIDWRGHAHPRG
jgi:hypothetical protein